MQPVIAYTVLRRRSVLDLLLVAGRRQLWLVVAAVSIRVLGFPVVDYDRSTVWGRMLLRWCVCGWGRLGCRCCLLASGIRRRDRCCCVAMAVQRVMIGMECWVCQCELRRLRGAAMTCVVRASI